MPKAEGPVPGADDPIEAFLAGLVAHDQPLLKRTSGVIRLDLSDGPVVEHRTVTIDDGRVSLSNRKGRADTVVQADRELFIDILGGKTNGMAAFLRGEMTAEGDLRLVVLFQRLFPGPPPGRGASRARRRGRERVGAGT